MKKLLILVPVSLLAVGGATFLSLEYSTPRATIETKAHISQSSVDPFTANEHLMRQILRYGDKPSLEALPASLKELEKYMSRYDTKGLDTTKIDMLVSQYIKDSTHVSKIAPMYMEKLKSTDSFERSHEKKFLVSLEQIGLSELKGSFNTLEGVRLRYIKEPNSASQEEYFKLSGEIKQIIAELYLDGTIEEPLFAYIDNHRLYFKTVMAMYEAIGVEKVERLRINSYAIKTELQLLPKI